MTKINRKYHLFNASDKVLGGLARDVAVVLRGKDKVDFAPNVDKGDFVVITNSDKVRVSGNKEERKVYHRYSGYPGGIKSATLREVRESDSRRILYRAVRGMLPKNSLRDKMLARLFVYRDQQYSHKIDVDHTK